MLFRLFQLAVVHSHPVSFNRSNNIDEMPGSKGYGTVNKQWVAETAGLGAGQKIPGMKKKSREERQPLLSGGQNEPVNDLYDRTPLPPRPDVRSSPDLAIHLPTNTGDTPTPEPKADTPQYYDPLLERNVEHPTSNLDTMIHLLKGNIGTGILAMPDAFRNAGLVVGLLGTLMMGAICTHCMHMLVRCAHELGRRHKLPSLSFSQVVEAAFQSGPYGVQPLAKTVKAAVNLFLCLTQLGFCCVYFVFVATNIQEFLNNYHVKLSLMTYLWILLFPMILLNLVKNLKFLTPVSLLASLCTVGGLGVTFFYLLQGLPRTSSVKAFSSWSQLPLYFGTAIYAFEGIGMVLPLENNMKTPQDFGGLSGVLNTGMVIVASLYTAVGFFGYLKYGNAVEVGSITLNLPHDILAQSVKVTMALAIFLSYGLQLYVPVNIIWPPLKQRYQAEWFQNFGEDILRTVLVVFTFGLAAMIPNLSAVISLVGAVSSSTLALIFPPIIEIVTFWNGDLGRYNWVLWKDALIVVFGVLGFGFGSYASIYNIVSPPSTY